MKVNTVDGTTSTATTLSAFSLELKERKKKAEQELLASYF